MGNDCCKRGNRGKLSDAEMSALSDETGFDPKSLRDMERRFLREAPSGHITEDEFVQIFTPYVSKSRSSAKGGFARHVFRACDTNGDGKMDFREFLIAVKLTTTENPQEKILWLFRIYDIDRNGMVTLNEVMTVLSSLSEILTIQEAKQLMENAFEIFEKFDINKDGQLSLQEIIDAGLATEQDKGTPSSVQVNTTESWTSRRLV